jgi:hypothetical protein
MPLYHELHFKDARILMEYLSPLNHQWRKKEYVFRGQGDSEHSLIPSACRRHPGSFLSKSYTRTFGDTSDAQVRYEQEVLKRFLDGCDNAGLVVPGYSDILKNELHREFKNPSIVNSRWPPQQYYEVLAAAQHHGIATRLLDWSRRSYVAAYFAATSADYLKSEGNVAIWALDVSNKHKWETVKVIDPPGGTSRNLAAQSGVFTMQHNIDLVNELYVESPLENISEIYEGDGEETKLKKFTLPVIEVPKLIKYCSLLGVTGSTLFPGYEGVARDVVGWAKDHIGVHGYYTPTYDDPSDDWL